MRRICRRITSCLRAQHAVLRELIANRFRWSILSTDDTFAAMKPIDEKLWNSWKAVIRSRGRLTKIDPKSAKDATIFGITGEDKTPWTLSIRRYRRYSVGIDIVGYT